MLPRPVSRRCGHDEPHRAAPLPPGGRPPRHARDHIPPLACDNPGALQSIDCGSQVATVISFMTSVVPPRTAEPHPGWSVRLAAARWDAAAEQDVFTTACYARERPAAAI